MRQFILLSANNRNKKIYLDLMSDIFWIKYLLKYGGNYVYLHIFLYKWSMKI